MKVTIFRDYKEQGWESMEVYANNLVKNLLKLKSADLDIKQFVAFKNLSRHFPKEKKFIRYFFRYLVNPPLSFFNQGEVNHIIDQSNAHLLQFLDPKKTIITCHDLIVPFWLSENRRETNFRKKIKDQGGKWRMNQLRRVAKIITVSQTTKENIMKRLKISSDKITVIQEGVEDFFKKIINRRLLVFYQEKYKLPNKYLLCVGSCEAYKNIEAILEVFALLSSKDKNLYLVKCGACWKKEHFQIIKKYSLHKKIKFLDYIPRHDLPFIYNLARALIQPSFIEGFGLTILEAMACGCPVIISATPALVELVGKTALILPLPIIPERASNEILEFLDSKKKRKTFSRLGIKRANLFTWQKTAWKTFKVYQQILKEN